MTISINGSAGITFPNNSLQSKAGSIIQVVSTLYTTPTSQSLTANSADTDITGLSVTITPSSITSRFLIMVRWTGETSAEPHDHLFFVRRNGTKINSQTGTSNRGSGTMAMSIGYAASSGPNNDSTPDNAVFATIDSPATTSAITYTLAIKNTTTATASTLYTNRTVADTDSVNYERTTSEIIVMEIGS
jgi:hypothetical protein